MSAILSNISKILPIDSDVVQILSRKINPSGFLGFHITIMVGGGYFPCLFYFAFMTNTEFSHLRQ